jgi:hypothetical protein
MSERRVVTPRFEILRRGEVIRSVPVNRSQLVIGSEDGANLRLKHPAIAPRHLEINVVQGRFLEASNLAGEGRVLLGNQPMNKARLREGDELDLGPVSLRLTFDRTTTGPHKPVPPTPDPVEEEPTVADARPLAPPPPPAAFNEDEPTDPGLDDESDTNVDLDDIQLDPVPIVVIEPPGSRPQRVPLRVGSFVVGAGRCAFRLSYPGVAPAHAEVMVMPDGLVYLKHLAGSGLLTLRNGAPVQFSRWMTGDRLQIGPVAMRLDAVPQSELTGAGRPVEGVPELPPGPVPAAKPPPRKAAPLAAPKPPPRARRAARAAALPSLGPAVVPPTPTPPPAAVAPPPAPTPAPVSRPVVKVRKRATAPTNTVSVSLDLSAQDTFAALMYDDDVEYSRPLAQRAALPVLFLLLLAVIGWQGYRLTHAGDLDADNGGPRTASGISGLDGGDAVVRRGDGPVRVGELPTKGSGRRSAGARSGSGSAGAGNKGIDWDDTERGMFFDTTSRRTLGPNGRIPVRVAEEVEREEPSAAPSEIRGVKQGFVEMKVVEKAIYAGRRKLKYCYTSARDTNEGLEGIMWLSLTLGTDSRIRGAVFEPRSTLKSEKMRKCLERQLYGLAMPTPEGAAVTFSYPFEFHPSD